MKKRIISLALSAAMLFAGFSISAFAEEPLTETEPAAAESVEEEAPAEEAPAAEEENSLFRKSDKTTETTEEKRVAPDGTVIDETAESTDAETEEEDDQLMYVALGDSICAGVGLTNVQYAHNLMGVDVSYNFKGYPETCYVGQVAKSLGLDRDHAINLGLPGLMSADLVELVKTGKMSEMNMLSGCQYDYPEMLEYIKEADIISIQMGSNDAFVPTVVAIGNATNWKSEDLASIILSGNLRSKDPETRAAFNESMKKLKLTKSETDAVWHLVTAGMNEICSDAYPVSSANIRTVVETVRELNPDAQILLIGATNPVPLLPSWSNYFNKLNKFQKQLAAVYDITYVAVPYAQTELDGHPTVSGHKYIANKIVKAIEKNK